MGNTDERLCCPCFGVSYRAVPECKRCLQARANEVNARNLADDAEAEVLWMTRCENCLQAALMAHHEDRLVLIEAAAMAYRIALGERQSDEMDGFEFPGEEVG